MKAVMYHYVRPDDPELPYFRHLHVDDFARQLEYFGNEFGFVRKQDFERCLTSGEPPEGVVLTFDDGFSDHHRYVLPELTRRGLWGIFYITTDPLLSGRLIDVHRIHLLIGRYGGSAIAGALREIVTEEMLTDSGVKEFRTETYTTQNNDESTTHVKRVLNYYIDYAYRNRVLDELMASHYPDERALAQDFYMTRAQLADMDAHGMVLGSHTVSHPVMSKLSPEAQDEEIGASFALLESVTGAPALKTFCYPYGGFHTFTDTTEQLLEKHACRFAFNVEPRDVAASDLTHRRQALPRFDCNQFPHGACRR